MNNIIQLHRRTENTENLQKPIENALETSSIYNPNKEDSQLRDIAHNNLISEHVRDLARNLMDRYLDYFINDQRIQNTLLHIQTTQFLSNHSR